jgi:flagellar motor switch protein FliN
MEGRVTEDRGSATSWFAKEWTTLLGNVLESLGGERPRLACKAPPGGAPLASLSQEVRQAHGDILWWEQDFPLPGEPALWIGAPRQAWTRLANRVLGAAEVEDASQARETYFEILRQSFAELARSAGRRWNREVACAVGAERAAPPTTNEFWIVEAVWPNATVPALLVCVTGKPEGPEAALMKTPAADALPARQSKTFDLLMGVELPVSVSFGRVQLPLKDVLKLTAGSIVELDRSVDEMVEVIVNNCVVARGEVVVVEGNYGVRIHQIMTRQQRLESLP